VEWMGLIHYYTCIASATKKKKKEGVVAANIYIPYEILK
jgi:hypothetical protein